MAFVKYRDDTQSQKYFGIGSAPGTKHNTRTGANWQESPIKQSLKLEGEGYEAHSFGIINPYKVCKVFIGGVECHNKGINPKVLLWPSVKEWEFSYEHKYESAFEKLSQNGMLSKLQQLNEALRTVAMVAGAKTEVGAGGRMLSKYKEAPAWTGVTPLQVGNSVTFNFRFGQAGLFDAETEVAAPIRILARQFAAVKGGTGSNYTTGPMPTAPAYFAQFTKDTADDLAGFAEKMKNGMAAQEQESSPQEEEAARELWEQKKKDDPKYGTGFFGGKLSEDEVQKKLDKDWEKEKNQAIKEYKEGDAQRAAENEKKFKDNLADAVNKLTALEDAILNKMNTTIHKVLYGPNDVGVKGTFLRLEIGHIKTPDLKVGSVSWKYDMTHTDENGYPLAGFITFGGLEGIEFATSGNLATI
jgi:hypothetical protein